MTDSRATKFLPGAWGSRCCEVGKDARRSVRFAEFTRTSTAFRTPYCITSRSLLAAVVHYPLYDAKDRPAPSLFIVKLLK